MIAILFIAMVYINRQMFLPCPGLVPLFGVLAVVAMVAEGLK